MPIVTFHLTDGVNSTEAMQRLLVQSSHLYAKVLDSPVERLRAFVNLYPAELVAVAGELVSESPRNAPYFEFLVLAGRPLQQRHDLMREFTELLVEILGAPRELVRGRAIVLDPDDWAIAGEPAGVRRASEIAARLGARS
jgi:phenylpyruvate tautomerase PptA (4-oxalocrotonate tautomerase family)